MSLSLNVYSRVWRVYPTLRAGFFLGRLVCLTVFFRVCVGTCLRECLFRCTLVLQGVCLMGAWGGFVLGRNV